MKCDELMKYGMNDPTIGDDYEMYRVADVDAAIDELKEKLEDVQATAYAESMDAGMENHRLQRALWLARAERAVAAQSVHEWCRYNEKHPCGLWKADPFECWVQAWICVEKLCRKKAGFYL